MDPARLPPPTAIAALREGRPAVARGTVQQLLAGPFTPPCALPAGAPPLDAIAVARFDFEVNLPLMPPQPETIERGRPFLLRDETGVALVRVGHLGGWYGGRLREDFELRLGRPFVQGKEGVRDLYLRAIALGDEVVVAGSVRFESAAAFPSAAAGGGYRAAPSLAVIEAEALFDRDAWRAVEEAAARRRNAWWRRLLDRAR